jgi:hypothetical protein
MESTGIKVREVQVEEELSSQEREAKVIAEAEEKRKAEEAASGDGDGSGAAKAETNVDPEAGIDESVVVEFFKKKYGKEVSSLDEIINPQKEQEFLPEDVAAYLKFKKETGRGINDFIKYQQSADDVDENSLLRDYYKSLNSEYDEEDIDVLLADVSYDEEYDDEDHIKKAKIAKKKLLSEAKKWFNSEKDKYGKPLESSALSLPEQEQKQYEAFKEYIAKANDDAEVTRRRSEWFSKKTEEVFSGEFKGFEFDLNGNKVYFKPSEAEALKKAQSSPMNLISKYIDKDGMISDAAGYHKALAVAMNPEKFASFFFEQGAASAVENLDKEMKNVNTSTRSATSTAGSNQGFKVRSVDEGSGSGLRIRSSQK